MTKLKNNELLLYEDGRTGAYTYNISFITESLHVRKAIETCKCSELCSASVPTYIPSALQRNFNFKRSLFDFWFIGENDSNSI